MCGKLCTCAINHRGMTFHWRLVDFTRSPEEHVWDDVHCYTFVNGKCTNKQHWHCFLTISFYKNKVINIEQQHQKNNYATLTVDTALHLYIIYTSLYIINMSTPFTIEMCVLVLLIYHVQEHTLTNTPWHCGWYGLSQGQPVHPGDQGWTTSAVVQLSGSSEPCLWATTWWTAGVCPSRRQVATPPPKQRQQLV